MTFGGIYKLGLFPDWVQFKIPVANSILPLVAEKEQHIVEAQNGEISDDYK